MRAPRVPSDLRRPAPGAGAEGPGAGPRGPDLHRLDFFWLPARPPSLLHGYTSKRLCALGPSDFLFPTLPTVYVFPPLPTHLIRHNFAHTAAKYDSGLTIGWRRNLENICLSQLPACVDCATTAQIPFSDSSKSNCGILDSRCAPRAKSNGTTNGVWACISLRNHAERTRAL